MTLPKIFDAVVVGAGPAGVSCATWLRQLGFTPVLVDRNTQCGGLQLSNPYTNTWIATSGNVHGADVAAALHANVVRHGVQTRLGVKAEKAHIVEDHVHVALSSGETIWAQYLVLAGGVTPKTGGHSSRLGLIVGPGHAVEKTNFQGVHVAILGGGDSAFENYNFVMKGGAAQATIFARSLKARADLLSTVSPDNVVLGPYEMNADKSTVNGQVFDQILVLYGYEANQASLLGLDLAMKPNGFVWTNEECLTSHDRVYAIGELAQRAHPCCVTSMADGVVASKALQRRLEHTAVAKFAGIAKRMVGLGMKAL